MSKRPYRCHGFSRRFKAEAPKARSRRFKAEAPKARGSSVQLKVQGGSPEGTLAWVSEVTVIIPSCNRFAIRVASSMFMRVEDIMESVATATKSQFLDADVAPALCSFVVLSWLGHLGCCMTSRHFIRCLSTNRRHCA